MQEEIVIVVIHRFPCSLMWGDCMPQFHVRVCETKISICNRWELEKFKTTCKLVFNRFWKPSVSSWYFLYKPNQKTPLHLIVSCCEQKTFQRRNTPFLFPFFLSSFFFCCLNCLFQVEVFEAIQHILMSRAGWKVPKRVDVL